MAVVPVEVWESLTGTTVLHKTLLPDSGGAGASRGGPGQEVAIRNDSGSPMTVFCMANRTEFPPLGLNGGQPGRPRQHRINGEAVHPKGYYELAPGDVITLIQAGGAGFGPPAERDRAQVLQDVADGVVSAEGARRDYGVEVGD